MQSAPPQYTPATVGQRSAVECLAAASFRAPDDVRGCDGVANDMFCRHHVEWRREALVELSRLSARQLQSLRRSHAHASPARVDELHLHLARRWDERIQYVAPVQLREGVALQRALEHASLEPDAHDSGWRFHSHDELARVLIRSSPPLSAAVLHSSGSRPAGDEYEISRSESALCSSVVSRKGWVVASDHARDAPGANSAHMLALYRLFTDRQSSDVQHGRACSCSGLARVQ